jgi:hypothetical protein
MRQFSRRRLWISHRGLIVRRAEAQGQRLAVAHGANAADRRFDHRATVEDVDVALMYKAFLAQDLQRRLGIGCGWPMAACACSVSMQVYNGWRGISSAMNDLLPSPTSGRRG